MSFISKVIEDKDSFDLREHADGILLLLKVNIVRIKEFTFLFKMCNIFIIVKNWWNNGYLFIV